MQDRMIEVAKQDLARRQGVSVSDITVAIVSPEEWRDTSLGCPQPGGMYAQVITPGYRIVLQTGGKQYEYHTDTGNHAILCQVP